MSHTGPLTEHEAAAIAKLLRRAADDLLAGFSPRGAIRRANEWHGPLRGASTDPGGGGGGDPTGDAATGRRAWTTDLAAHIAANARMAGEAAELMHLQVARVPAPIDALDDDDDAAAAQARLDAENRRAGYCDTCGDECTGTRDDRLTALTVAWSVWSRGQEQEHREERSVCLPCRKAWDRAKARGEDFGEWERRRRMGVEKEAS